MIRTQQIFFEKTGSINIVALSIHSGFMLFLSDKFLGRKKYVNYYMLWIILWYNQTIRLTKGEFDETI